MWSSRKTPLFLPVFLLVFFIMALHVMPASSTLLPAITPTISTPSATYNETVNVITTIPSTGTGPYAYVWLVSYNDSSYNTDINDNPLNGSYCNNPIEFNVNAGAPIDCGFDVSNPTAVPQGLYQFELQVYDSSNVPQVSISAPASIYIGPVFALQGITELFTTQNDPLTIYVQNNIAPFNSITGPFKLYLTEQGYNTTYIGDITIPGQSLTVNVPQVVPGNNTFYVTADYFVSNDPTPISVQSPKFLTTVIKAPAFSPIASNVPNLTEGVPFILNTTILGGMGPFNIELLVNGTAVDAQNGVSMGQNSLTPITFPSLTLPIGTYSFQTLGTDFGLGSSRALNFSSPLDVVSVNSNVSTTTTTTSTTSLSTSSIVQITVQSGNGGGPGGGGSPGGGGGGVPTVERQGDCYLISNMTTPNQETVGLGGTRLNAVVNFIGPNFGGVTVNGTSYTIYENITYYLYNGTLYDFTMQLVKLLYIPVEHTINIRLCAISTTPTNPISSNQTTILPTSSSIKTTLSSTSTIFPNQGFQSSQIQATLPSSTPATRTYISIVNLSGAAVVCVVLYLAHIQGIKRSKQKKTAPTAKNK